MCIRDSVKPVRVQGAYVSDKEIFDTVEYIKNNSGEAEYDETIGAKLTTDMEASGGAEGDKAVSYTHLYKGRTESFAYLSKHHI